MKRATRTGETTGILRLDEIAVRLLRERAQHYELMRVLGAVLALAAASPPVIAAILISPLWLLADLPFSALLLYLSVSEYRDPRAPLHSLTEALPDQYG